MDRAPGGNPVHGIVPAEIDAILAVAEQWGTIDRSHRKLAHRGSYAGLVWVARSTFRRVLAAHGLVLPEPPARSPSVKRPWPDWLICEPNKIWIYDATHFGRARRVVFDIVDARRAAPPRWSRPSVLRRAKRNRPAISALSRSVSIRQAAELGQERTEAELAAAVQRLAAKARTKRRRSAASR